MIAEMREALQPALSEVLGREVEISEPVLLAGGASKEAWSVDADGLRLLVRRAAGGVIHRHTLSLEDEFAVLEAAYEGGVKAPRPYGYIPDLSGREAFVMERLEGDTIGRRIVQKDELAAARAALPVQMAEELAKIHAIPAERVSFLPESRLEQMVGELLRGRPFGHTPAVSSRLQISYSTSAPSRPSVASSTLRSCPVRCRCICVRQPIAQPTFAASSQ